MCHAPAAVSRKCARRASPTGAVLSLQGNLQRLHLWKTNKTKFTILDNMSGILHPGRFTLLLGPPGAGKSTLLNALAGRLQKHPTCRVRAGLLICPPVLQKAYCCRVALLQLHGWQAPKTRGGQHH